LSAPQSLIEEVLPRFDASEVHDVWHATRALLRYWRAIRLGSGAIRKSWLAAIRRRAVRAELGGPGA
jgi:hypothetical protein